MKNELQEHKMSDKIKWICTLVAFLLVGVLLIGIICGWFEKKEDKPTNVVESGIAVTLPESNGVKLTKTMLTAAQYDAYGISPQAESAFTITATVKESGGTAPDAIQQVNWSMSWASPDNASVTDYVTMSTTETTAVFSCLQGFSTQIIVTCVSEMDENVSATATLDYAKRLMGIEATIQGKKYVIMGSETKIIPVTFNYASSGFLTNTPWTDMEFAFCDSYVYSDVGTITPNPNGGMSITYSDDFKAATDSIKGATTYTFSTLSYGGSSAGILEKKYCQRDLLTGLADNGTPLTNYVGKYLNLFSQTSNQIEVTISLSDGYSSFNTTYILDVSLDVVPASIELDNVSHTF